MRRTVPPSAEIQAEIDKLLSRGMVDDPQKMLSELARLGARLIIQRAVEDEFDAWLGRARYERRPERQRGLRNYESGLRNGFRPRQLQTGEGELGSRSRRPGRPVVPFVSKLFPKWHCKRLLRTDPLKALVIGGFVRGLSMRDVESLCEEAGLGQDVEVDGGEDLRGAARAVRGVLSPLALRRQSGRAVPATRSISRSAPAARRRA